MLNHIALMGRLVKDPELRHTTSGTPVASFRLAVERDFKGESGEKEAEDSPRRVAGNASDFALLDGDDGELPF